jgi:hypothetical protein
MLLFKFLPSTIGADPIIDFSFAMCLIGIIMIVIAGLTLPQSREPLLDKIIFFGAATSAIGGIILMARIM